MSYLIRRSNLMVSMGDEAAIAASWQHNADAVTLNVEGHAAQRAGVKAAIASAAKGGAEVFVRISTSDRRADLEAAVWPGLSGLSGVMLPRVESAAEVTRIDEIVSALEQQRGIKHGSLQFIVGIESARGVWDMRSIIKASARITQALLDETKLAVSLGFTPLPELDPFDYARGRLVVECTAAKIAPVGMAYPLSAAPCELPDAQIHELATKAKNLGMKGVLCPHASWVVPVNAAFTPTAALVEWNQRVRVAFAEGLAAGTAAVPLDGKMIDVPVDEWAIVVLAMAEACSKRDTEKREALERAEKT